MGNSSCQVQQFHSPIASRPAGRIHPRHMPEAGIQTGVPGTSVYRPGTAADTIQL